MSNPSFDARHQDLLSITSSIQPSPATVWGKPIVGDTFDLFPVLVREHDGALEHGTLSGNDVRGIVGA